MTEFNEGKGDREGDKEEKRRRALMAEVKMAINALAVETKGRTLPREEAVEVLQGLFDLTKEKSGPQTSSILTHAVVPQEIGDFVLQTEEGKARFNVLLVREAGSADNYFELMPMPAGEVSPASSLMKDLKE
ncbi:hypothetical protein EPN28_00815 [Patescibacteria group bacterium]|nr:MAG: hypothetical protein EPN28_00815 [Patescibacteria group bacterium]